MIIKHALFNKQHIFIIKNLVSIAAYVEDYRISFVQNK